jgi:putative DNA primase/helicase
MHPGVFEARSGLAAEARRIGDGPLEGAALADAVEEVFTELAHARRLATKHGAELRFLDGHGWAVFRRDTERGGLRWQLEAPADAKAAVHGLAREVKALGDALAEVLSRHWPNGRPKPGHSCFDAYKTIAGWYAKAKARHEWACSAVGVERTLQLAAAFPALRCERKAFDADPWLLNCPNGTVDLRTGELRRHDPSAMLSKMAAVEYRPLANRRAWDGFLQGSFAKASDPAALIAWLQVWAGYCATGDNKTHVAVWLYGRGRNGKTVLAEAWQGVLGDYSAPAMAGFFEVQSRMRHSAEDADLDGVRLAIHAEADSTATYDAVKLKKWTGGDSQKARGMRENPRRIHVCAKHVFYCNRVPRLDGSDDALWRRLVFVPFEMRFRLPHEAEDVGEALADPTLAGQFKADPAVLAWMVEGAVEYNRRGGLLPVPADCVRLAQRLRDGADALGAFLRAATQRRPGARLSKGDLWDAWEAWALEAESEPRSRKWLSQELKAREWADSHTNGGRMWLGFELKLRDARDGNNRFSTPSTLDDHVAAD